MQSDIIALLNQRIQTAIGLDTSTLGPSALTTAVKQRSSIRSGHRLDHGEVDWRAYLAALDSDPSELTGLIDALVVPETWFFRDPAAFEALRHWAVNFLQTFPADRRVNLLSLPCATGEEPYSIAMALLDAGISSDRFRVISVDVSEPLLDRMRQGIFGANSFRHGDLVFRVKHFSPEQNGRYRLKPEIMEQTVIRKGNIFAPHTFAEFAPYHAIFCRNLLIYFNRQNQKRALSILTEALVERGVLFLGHAEGSALNPRGFKSLETRHSFGFIKTGSSRDTIHPTPNPASQNTDSSIHASPSETRNGQSKSRPGTRRTNVTGGYRPNKRDTTSQRASPRPESSTPDRITGVPPDLTAVHRLADAGRLADAAAQCELELRNRGPGSDVYFLLGVIRDSMKQYDAAAECYRKAIYLAPNNSDALLHLSLLRERQGANDEARRLELRAKRIVQQSTGASQ